MKRTCSLLSLTLTLALPVPFLVAGAEKATPAVDSNPAHWAFEPPRLTPVPSVVHTELVRTAVDRFLEAALEKQGLSLGPEVDRSTLLRRVSFDLTGLPPAPPEIAAFLDDTSPDAYERMIERYLSSPRYGERWGKYWLDAAGYADSNGYFSADTDRPLAYRYRDYVIRAFNQDKPYDRFVQEQLAGDEIAGFAPGGDVASEMVELLEATHFLRNAPDGTAESDGNPDEVRIDRFTVLEGNLQNVMNCLLGITIQCARCHEHKFEPIRHDEYYRLQAILYPVYPAYGPERWTKPNDRVVTIATRARREEHRRTTERLQRQIKALETGLQTIADPLLDQVLEERAPELDAAARSALVKAFRTPTKQRTPEHTALLKKHEQAIKISDDELTKRFPDYATVRADVTKAIAARRAELPAPLEKLAVVMETDPEPPVHHVLHRGQHNVHAAEVQPGVPAALDPQSRFRVDGRPSGQISSGRRLAFARWITSADNPLFARVMVNRGWQHHFGAGLVITPDNLGQSGARPSHRELLDYLAQEFVRCGWSVKNLHRLILRSAAYRQSSDWRADGFVADEDNRLLWRYPLRRLDAEAIRDAMLTVSGELDVRAGGPYAPTKRGQDGGVVVDESTAGAHRRSVYLQQRRTQVETFLELFDAPAISTTCSVRNTATVPLQSLALLNSDFARARARAFAGRLLRDARSADEDRLSVAYEISCGREPRADERAACRRFLAARRGLAAANPDAESQTWTDLCQMILASNAFIYVE
jgi:hypothetical protein